MVISNEHDTVNLDKIQGPKHDNYERLVKHRVKDPQLNSPGMDKLVENAFSLVTCNCK